MLRSMSKPKKKLASVTPLPPPAPIIPDAARPADVFSDIDRLELQNATERIERIKTQLDLLAIQMGQRQAELQQATVKLSGLRIALERRYAIGEHDVVSIESGSIQRKG